MNTVPVSATEIGRMYVNYNEAENKLCTVLSRVQAA